MEVAVPPNNPGKVTSVTDLAKSSLKVALCQPQVPCGKVAAAVFENAGIKVKPVTLQPDVKSVLAQVELGSVDAGMVYVTDVMAAGAKVKGVTISPSVTPRRSTRSLRSAAASTSPSPRPSLLTCCHPRASRCSWQRGSRRPELAPGAATVTLAAPSHLTARERARRAARGGASRSVQAPLLAPALIAIGFLVLPLAGLLIRAPWGRLAAALSGSDATQALILSLWTASASTAISLVIGVPLAWVLARSSFPGQRLLRALVTLPLVLPPVVGGWRCCWRSGEPGLSAGIWTPGSG